MAYVEISGTQYYYEDDSFADPWTKRETVFIQHGNLKNAQFFYHWVPRLSRKYRVIRRDFPGFGGSSDLPAGRDWSVGGMLSDLVGFLDALGLDKVHYVGEATGGVLGAVFASKHAERLHSLTLVSTPISDPGSRTAAKFYGFERYIDVFDGLTIDQFIDATIAQEILDGLEPDHREWVRGEWKKNKMSTMKAIAVLFPTVNLTETLPKIAVPTLMLSPTRSKVAPLEEQERMAKMIPDARMVPLEGWNISLEQPEACLDALLDFLASQKAPQPA